MKKAIILFTAILCSALFSYAQELPQLPNDPEVKTGKLGNGLTYYIRHNDKPAKRAEFYLATNVGALQETPDQDGLAHFLEHMCFNGTKNFPGKGILNWLESIGASFGGNVNASTGVEQTVYLLNNIPLVRPSVVDTCLLIMHDYSHFVTCDPVEIDKERGVILEEKRSRNTASWRMWEETRPYLYGDTKYATTTIIGSEENLKTFKPESLTNFYKTWYVPCNQALIVVGDIDVNEVEAKIASTFADIPAAENPAKKTVHKVPGNADPIVGIITDPEATSSDITLIWKKDARPEALNSTPAGLTLNLAESIVRRVMFERFSDIAAKPDAPFTGASFSIGKICETMEAADGSVEFKDGNHAAAFESFFTEIEKMRRYGFSDNEVERAKTEILSQYEEGANKASTRKNPEFVRPLINHFFDSKAYMDPGAAFEIVKSLMPQLNSAMINQMAASLITKENLVVIFEGPEGKATPTKDELLSIISKVSNAEIARNAGDEVPTEFLNAAALKGCKAGKSSTSLYGSETFTLKNGVKVFLLPTDYEKDKISIDFIKKGGSSLIADEDLPSFENNILSCYFNNTGVAEFSATTVSKMLAGKQVFVEPSISTTTHGINAVTTKKDLETAFQLGYLYFAKPRFDQDEFNQGVKQIEAVLPNLDNNPKFKLQRAISENVYEKPSRHLLVNKEILSKANLQTIEKVYRNLFKDAAGAILVVVGDFDKETVMPLICKYVGSLPKGKKASDWTNSNGGIKTENVLKDFRTSLKTPKTTVVQLYNQQKAYTVEDKVALDALRYILNMTYVETLREDEGGTYGASVSGSASDSPLSQRHIEVFFETNDNDADKLRALAVKGMKDIAENGPSEKMYDKTIKNLLKKIPESKLRNSYWSAALERYALRGYDYITLYEAAVNALTPEKVKATAADLVANGSFLEIVMRPE